ncbi:MAG: ATP-binding protein [Oculatellaceae cyanobacterium bins.114]|nr:ATP-binding protein [Oculatellaceae cyanobacterium bins.114]
MFQQIRHRLLVSYLVVFAAILGTSAIAIRITFERDLTEELTDRLETLAQAATTDLEVEGERLIVDDEEALVVYNQALQWFDPQGNLIGQQGNYIITLPFQPHRSIQTQIKPEPIQAITIPIHDSEGGTVIGYVRASESMRDLQNTLHRLEWELGIGIIIALALSCLGGIWLTHQAMQPIEQSFHRLQQFTADASHELRSPLMVIKSNATVALRHPEGMRELDAEKFHAIDSAITQMSALTEALLTLARTDQALPLKQEVIDLTTLLEKLMQWYKIPAEEKQIQLKAQIEPHLFVLGDAVQLTRLFTNLMDNALFYTPEQGTVELQASLGRANLTITLQDTGVGIASDQLPHVFDRFWRADRSRSCWSEGFGLGLAIAQGIAHNHGGMITVSSHVGVGSCFSVCLPTYLKT